MTGPFVKKLVIIFGIFLLLNVFWTSSNSTQKDIEKTEDEKEEISQKSSNQDEEIVEFSFQEREKASEVESGNYNFSEAIPAGRVSSEEVQNKKPAEEKAFVETTETKPSTAVMYNVTSVVDGDTLKIDLAGKIETIRVIGFDTPETVHPTKAVECFGKEASAKAKSLLANTAVGVVFDESQGKRDKYGRLLAYITLSDGRDLGEVLLKEGYAYEYTYSQKYQNQKIYKEAENYARINKLGLWADSACSSRVQKIPVTVSEKEGEEGVVKKAENFSANNECLIKGNINSKKENIYHMKGQNFYEKTIISEEKGERWFCSEEEAVLAGWRKSKI